MLQIRYSLLLGVWILFWGFSGCKISGIEPPISLLGHWEVAYQHLPDGGIDTSQHIRYSILGFEYSDGFVLKEEGKIDITWYGMVNVPDRTWRLEDSTLIIDSGTAAGEFRYLIRQQEEDGMDFVPQLSRNPDPIYHLQRIP